VIPASSIANTIALAAPSPSSHGDVIWNASLVAPYPTTSAKISAPLACACSRLSKTTIPDPSPMTNPSLSLSNGIDALFGSSDPLKAVNAANPPTATSDTAASVPPATITSASPT